MSKSIYFPGLNGLRAIAALAVVISHTTQSLGDFGLNPYILGKTYEGTPLGLDLAGYGVSIFFSLSGFLITYLLLTEKNEGTINIRNFYFRRILRIWPLYYLYILIAILTSLAFGKQLIYESLFFYIFLSANIPLLLNTSLPFLFHYWSLGVEEQFYLFWPWLTRIKTKLLLKISILMFVSLICLKLVLKIIDIRYGFHIPYLALHVTRFHCMLIGAIAAIYFFNKNELFIKYTTLLPIQLICWSIILITAFNQFQFFSVIDNEIISIVTVGLIMGQIIPKKKLLDLENKVLDFLGKISYGIYVFHPIIIFYMSKLIGNSFNNSFLSYLIIYLLISGATISVAYLSYTYYEKRFLKKKLKFSTVISLNSKQPA